MKIMMLIYGRVKLDKCQRLVLGIFLLLLVVLIWVASSELTQFLFIHAGFDKPFFTTYFKTSLFMLYLSGFLFIKSWRSNQPLVSDVGVVVAGHSETEQLLGDPHYVPVKRTSDTEKSSGTESDDATSQKRGVRFSRVVEVRQMPDAVADEAKLARLSYIASLQAEEAKLRSQNKLTVKQVAKVAATFCFVWFFANYSYQKALAETEPAVVNVLSSTSGLFTLILAAMFPSTVTDKFTLTKLMVVLLSIGGVVMVSLSDLQFNGQLPAGSLWALSGAVLYAVYLVFLKRKVENEEKMDFTMFFGFVGLFNCLFMWPGFLILHYSAQETFQWPNSTQWLYLSLNGFVGTVISDLLWLWGCFLTSSLVATLSLSMTIPLTTLADIFMNKVTYTLMFFLGSVPIFLSFFITSLLVHYDNCDPLLFLLKKALYLLCHACQKKTSQRLREQDREQSESLIISTDS